MISDTIIYHHIFHPFYFQSVNTSAAMRCRLLKFLIPVLVMSLAFNIPKVFECYVEWVPQNVTNIVAHNETYYRVTNYTVSIAKQLFLDIYLS